MGRKNVSCFRHVEVEGSVGYPDGSCPGGSWIDVWNSGQSLCKRYKAVGKEILGMDVILRKNGEQGTSRRTKSLRISTLKGYAEKKLPDE